MSKRMDLYELIRDHSLRDEDSGDGNCRLGIAMHYANYVLRPRAPALAPTSVKRTVETGDRRFDLWWTLNDSFGCYRTPQATDDVIEHYLKEMDR